MTCLEKPMEILSAFSDKLKQCFTKDEFKCYRIEADKFAIISRESERNVQEFQNQCEEFANYIEQYTFIIEEHEIDLNISQWVLLRERKFSV